MFKVSVYSYGIKFGLSAGQNQHAIFTHISAAEFGVRLRKQERSLH